jgi:hypothetical protein
MSTQIQPPTESRDKELEEERAAHELIEEGKHALERIGDLAKKPGAGALIAGALVAGAAGLWGATEAAVGVVAAYGVYRILRRRKDRAEEGPRTKART